jgi:hypothetical protein
MHRSRLAFWGVSIIIISSLFITTKNDPFFGDSIATISRASNHIFSSNFNEISYPPKLDPGHPITFSAVHAIAWKVFGRQLWVSHLLNLIFGFLILNLFVKWGKQLGYGNHTYLGALFLLVTPLFISQIANPNLHLPLTFFALGLVYSLSTGKRWHQVLFASALILTHLQGLYYLVPIWLWWIAKSKDIKLYDRIKYSAITLAIPAALFIGWMIYHYSISGWYISSPDYAGHRGFPGVKRFVVNMIMADWRIVDYGQIALWVLPIWAVIKSKIRWTWNHPFTLMLIVFLFNSIAIAVTTKTGPMHRYLLPCLPLLVMANIDFLKSAKTRTTIVLLLLLVSGHFWFYPGKIMGDATLSYRSVFPLLEEAKEDFGQPTFHTYAPLSNSSYETKLGIDTNDYVALYDRDITDVSYVIRSNISGDFSWKELNMLESDWPSKTYQSGYVYVEVYSNPTLVPNPITGPKRQASAFEKWFIKLKNKIKGKDSV